MKAIYARTQYWFGLTAGGSVGHTAGVIEGLDQLGDVRVLTNDTLHGVDPNLCRVVPPVLPSLRWWGEAFYGGRFSKALRKEIAAFQPDFVYHRYSAFSNGTAKTCLKTDTPLVLEFNSSTRWALKYWQSNSLKQKIVVMSQKPIVHRFEPFNVEAATMIVVVSQPLKDTLISWGIPEERVLVNPNAVDIDKFKPSSLEVTQELRAELGIPEDKIVVGFSGTFGRWHGVPELRDAILKLNENPSNRDQLTFVLYGDGELLPDIKGAINHFPNVIFTGKVEYSRMQDYLSICDIFLSPHCKTPDDKPFFGSPTKLFEYLAMGRGVVASRLDQLAEIVKEGETGILVEPSNVDELVEGVMYLVDNPAERKRLGENARKDAEQRFTWKQNVQNMIDALNRLGISV